jgi:hypothetical protein
MNTANKPSCIASIKLKYDAHPGGWKASILLLVIGLIFFIGMLADNTIGFRVSCAVAFWVFALALFGFIPSLHRWASAKYRWLEERKCDAIACFVSGVLLITIGCFASGYLLLLVEEPRVQIKDATEGFATFIILMSAVTGGTLCADSILGIESDGGSPLQITFCQVALFNLALFSVILTLFNGHWNLKFLIGLIVSAVATCITPVLVKVEAGQKSAKSPDDAFRIVVGGTVLIAIGAVSAFIFQMDGAKTIIGLFSKDFFPSYTSAIGACLLARGLERNRI